MKALALTSVNYNSQVCSQQLTQNLGVLKNQFCIHFQYPIYHGEDHWTVDTRCYAQGKNI